MQASQLSNWRVDPHSSHRLISKYTSPKVSNGGASFVNTYGVTSCFLKFQHIMYVTVKDGTSTGTVIEF